MFIYRTLYLPKIPLELKGLPLSKFKTELKQHLISMLSIKVSLDMI